MIDLKALAARTYRVTLDESASILGQTTEDRAWLYQIPGKDGAHVFVQSKATLGVFVRLPNGNTSKLRRLLALPGARPLQRGDEEASVEFPPEQLDAVADIVRLRRRRQVSPEERARLAAMGKANLATLAAAHVKSPSLAPGSTHAAPDG